MMTSVNVCILIQYLISIDFFYFRGMEAAYLTCPGGLHVGKDVNGTQGGTESAIQLERSFTVLQVGVAHYHAWLDFAVHLED